jgi:hypothetical protein
LLAEVHRDDIPLPVLFRGRRRTCWCPSKDRKVFLKRLFVDARDFLDLIFDQFDGRPYVDRIVVENWMAVGQAWMERA